MPAVLQNNLFYPEEKKTVRCVVLGRDTQEPREVYTATRSGGYGDITTRQIIKDGDLVVAATVNDTTQSILTEIYVARDTSQYPIQLDNIINGKDKIQDTPVDLTGVLNIFKHIPLSRWLYDTDMSGLLPKGIGWDGVSTEYEKEKLKEVNYFLDGVPESFLDNIAQPIMFSPSNQIPVSWKDAKLVLPGTAIYFDEEPNCHSRFAIEWSEDFVLLEFEQYDAFKEKVEYTAKNKDTTRILLGSIKKNAYGLILQWSLYHLSN